MPLGALAICAVASCSAGFQEQRAKVTRFADDFADICLANPRNDAGVAAVAASRGILLKYPISPGERGVEYGVLLNPWENTWTCLLDRDDGEGSISGLSLTYALDRWPDGELIQWGPPERRPRGILLYFASRQVGNNFITVRTNRLDDDLVYYMTVEFDS